MSEHTETSVADVLASMVVRRGSLLFIFAAIADERQWQELLHEERSIAAPELEQSQRLAILAEEFGEVARKVLDLESTTRPSAHFVQDLDDLKTELTQCAAVCVGWLEALS